MRHKKGKATMSEKKDNTAHDMSRRNVLLATTSIAAVSALGAAASVEKALAQAQPGPSGQRPNILVIMGTMSVGSTSAPITAG
jgi:arylsulfatase